MIIVTRLNGPPFAVNPDLLERVESTPDTILTLIDGTKYVITEPVEEVVRRVREYRATIIATAHALERRHDEDAEDAAATSCHHEGRLHLAAVTTLQSTEGGS